jgi:hypothetical protein
MKKLLAILLCLGIIGCATPTNKYAGAYNEAVAAGHSVVIIKEGDPQTIKDGIDWQLGSIGYNKVDYASSSEGFMVFEKDANFGSALLTGDKDVYKIILKYTNADIGKTRIDLVNGSGELSKKDAIDKDIQRLAELIKSS